MSRDDDEPKRMDVQIDDEVLLFFAAAISPTNRSPALSTQQRTRARWAFAEKLVEEWHERYHQ